MKIEVDKEVFDFLQKNAIPLVDDANNVLRRLLLKNAQTDRQVNTESIARESDSLVRSERKLAFIRRLLKQEFGGDFRVLRPYQFMYVRQDRVVYVQNYDKESDKLWYRIDEKAWDFLRAEDRQTTICLTNPSEGIAYLFPVRDIEAQVRRAEWERGYLEINIDHVSHRWIELDWSIAEYLKTV